MCSQNREGAEGDVKGLRFSDADDAHSFLQKCRNDAPENDVVADAISLDSVRSGRDRRRKRHGGGVG